jgi:uncharacterized protein (TIGR03083 family)
MRRQEIAVAVKDERRKLVFDLSRLSQEEWDAQSLCDRWRVRDVVGHLIRLYEWNKRVDRGARDVLASGFRVNRALLNSARRIGSAPPDELLERLESARTEKTLAFRLHPQPLFALAELIVHGQDIRRPLGLTSSFDANALKAVGDVSTKWYTWGGRQRRRQERLEATDTDWATGEGPPILRGPMEAVVMVLYAREAAMADLTQQ